MIELRGKSRKIFGFKELIGKIFRTKELVPGRIVAGRYAQRGSYIRIREAEGRRAVT
jgi:hypothetical protein